MSKCYPSIWQFLSCDSGLDDNRSRGHAAIYALNVTGSSTKKTPITCVQNVTCGSCLISCLHLGTYSQNVPECDIRECDNKEVWVYLLFYLVVNPQGSLWILARLGWGEKISEGERNFCVQAQWFERLYKFSFVEDSKASCCDDGAEEERVWSWSRCFLISACFYTGWLIALGSLLFLSFMHVSHGYSCKI